MNDDDEISCGSRIRVTLCPYVMGMATLAIHPSEKSIGWEQTWPIIIHQEN
jgi:hypothetical protein